MAKRTEMEKIDQSDYPKVRFPPELYQRARVAAAIEGMSTTAYLVALLEKALPQLPTKVPR